MMNDKRGHGHEKNQKQNVNRQIGIGRALLNEAKFGKNLGSMLIGVGKASCKTSRRLMISPE